MIIRDRAGRVLRRATRADIEAIQGALYRSHKRTVDTLGWWLDWCDHGREVPTVAERRAMR